MLRHTSLILTKHKQEVGNTPVARADASCSRVITLTAEAHKTLNLPSTGRSPLLSVGQSEVSVWESSSSPAVAPPRYLRGWAAVKLRVRQRRPAHLGSSHRHRLLVTLLNSKRSIATYFLTLVCSVVRLGGMKRWEQKWANDYSASLLKSWQQQGCLSHGCHITYLSCIREPCSGLTWNK